MASMGQRWFQFQSGAINSKGRRSGANQCGKFQFQSGAINSPVHTRIKPSSNWFQFQSGAINSNVSKEEILYEVKFQFQSGAINSLVPVLLGVLVFRFNSNQVRLTGAGIGGEPWNISSFNSNQVRLTVVVRCPVAST